LIHTLCDDADGVFAESECEGEGLWFSVVRGCETLAEHELAEILVGGEKQDFRFPRESEDVEVGAAGRFFPEVDDGVALRAESLNDLPLDPFVGDDSHAAGKG
jgi:hypothetical protein